MARKKGRPPKTPSSSSKKTPSAEKRPEASSSLEFSLSDEEALEDIESLTPKKAAELLQSIDLLWQRVQSLVAILENKLRVNSMCNTIERFVPGWQYVSNIDYHPVGRICVAWKPDMFRVTVLKTSSQLIHCLIFLPATSVQWMATFVYGANDHVLRRDLWDDLREIKMAVNCPWLVSGDFNCCLDPSEKLGGNQVDWEAMEEFRECIHDCGLQDMKFCGNLFTWCNRQYDGNRIYSKLDRNLVNEDWIREQIVWKERSDLVSRRYCVSEWASS
ncbi:hypothetical protein RIF29_10230 [Crotalaria pallida]|uniref:Endonuclease/exonuclease/phosphatase domain-containing protein n=1 Tax=Crotalaria pallida TaxID=3830 RepID=A0AAN9FSP5_CROPI